MTALCMVPKLEYNACIIVSRDNTSSNIDFFSSVRVDIVTKSPPCLETYSSFTIHSFSAIKKWTLDLVTLAYTLVASAKATRFLCTSVTFTHSSTFAGDVWSSKFGTLWDCRTLWWDSSKVMLCISPPSCPPRISMPPYSFKTFSSSGWIEVGDLTSLWWGMRLVSCSNSCCSMFASNCWSDCSISCVKYHSCDGSDESTTCTGDTSFVYTCCTLYYIYYCCSSLSCLHSSYSLRSCSLNSCNSSSTSSILFLSLWIHVICLSCCFLFSWIAIVSYSTSWSAQNCNFYPPSCDQQFSSFLCHTQVA